MSTIRITAASCSLYVLGFDMKCPVCKTLVKSGETHACTRPIVTAPKPRKTGGKR